MKALILRHTISFKNAFAGLFWAFRTQPNFRIHFILAACALIGGLYLGISQTEMLVIIFTIVLGLMGELINTSIEAMTDLITKEWKQEAKIAKDVGAGMMLFVAFGAFIIACYIFIPYILKLFFTV
jgi:diacylglycerol kinase (ATP)